MASSCAVNNENSPNTEDVNQILSRDLNGANPIVIIPGIGGSTLIEPTTGKTVWGAFGYNTYWPATAEENKLLSLPLRQDLIVSDQNINHIISRSVLDTFGLNILPRPFKSLRYSVYLNIYEALVKVGYIPGEKFTMKVNDSLTRGAPVYQFAYDWRQSNTVNAKKLSEYIDNLQSQLVKDHPSAIKPQVDLVCHSMGCLLARYYLRYGEQGLGSVNKPPVLDWRGARKVENLVMVAPPNRGSISAFVTLIDGFYIRPFKLFQYPAAVVGTMPSMYELLPRTDIANATNQDGGRVDIMDPKLWQDMRWGLLDSDQQSVLKEIAPEYMTNKARIKAATVLQEQLLFNARRFHLLLDTVSERPPGLKYWLFAGVGELTDSKIFIDNMTKSYSTNKAKLGDGSVIRQSAYAIKNPSRPDQGTMIQWDNAAFFHSHHLELVKSNDFLVNFFYTLSWGKYLDGDR